MIMNSPIVTDSLFTGLSCASYVLMLNELFPVMTLTRGPAHTPSPGPCSTSCLAVFGGSFGSRIRGLSATDAPGGRQADIPSLAGHHVLRPPECPDAIVSGGPISKYWPCAAIEALCPGAPPFSASVA